MKVFVVWSVPDYQGIDIEAIFRKEEDAVLMVNEHNVAMQIEHKDLWKFYKWDYSEYELY